MTAMCLMDECIEYASNIVKKLYPKIGEIHGISAYAAERNIREEIEAIYNRTNSNIPEDLTGTFDKGKLTNKEFLVRLFMLIKRRS